MSLEYRAFVIRGDDGQEYGPVDREELREWVRENRAGLGTVVRLDEPGAAWHPWQDYPELVALLAEVHVTTPIPGQPGLVIAPLGRRALAMGIDLILILILLVPIFFVVTLTCMPDWFIHMVVTSVVHPYTPADEPPLQGKIIESLIYLLALISYMAGFHAVHGQTPAKALLRLRVVDQYGNKPRFIKLLLRAMVLFLSLNIYLSPFLFYAFFNPQRRTFHDFVAGTYVVKA